MKSLSKEFSQLRSLLQNLPYGDVEYYGTLLRNFVLSCDKALSENVGSTAQFNNFIENLNKSDPRSPPDVRAILARFVQFIEREVALLDALEESSTIQNFDMGHNPDFNIMSAWVKRERLQKNLSKALRVFSLRIVLTAHPTEFYPYVIQRLIRELSQALANRDEEMVESLVAQLSKTSFRHRDRISPEIEADRLICYLKDVFYPAIPIVEQQLRRHLCAADVDADAIMQERLNRTDSLVTMGFWPGGDRDGNPRITCEVTLNILNNLRRTVLSCYIKTVEQLAEKMTFVGLEEKLEIILRRLRATQKSSIDVCEPDVYSDFNEFQNDLEDLRKTILREHQGVFVELLEPLFTAVECFGFHFASMDLRQDSGVHLRLIQLAGEFLAVPTLDWDNAGEQEKDAAIERIVNHRDKIEIDRFLAFILAREKDENQVCYQTARIMSRIPDILKCNGFRAMHRYIISNAVSKHDCLILYALLHIFIGSEIENIDIVPLFESIEALKGSYQTMEALFNDRLYTEHLRKRNNHNTIMLGFSDGTKDGGYLAGSGSIFFAKQELSKLGKKYNQEIIFFDGRGGPPGRGGGSVTDYYASMGPLVQSKQIQLTIQGQTVSSSFASVQSAVNTISSYVATGLENRVLKLTDRLRHLTGSDREILREMIDSSRARYRDLVDHPGFIPFLTQVTPFQYFTLANHSSRPSKRKGAVALDNIRAIPFVASWNQMKLNIPGYFGFGHALNTAIEKYGLERLRQLFEDSRFFRAMLTDSEKVLKQTDERYSRFLSSDSRYSRIFQMICEECRLCRKWMSQIHSSQSSQSTQIREELQRPAIFLQQHCLNTLRNASSSEASDEINGKDSNKFYQDMVVKLMAIIINAGRNSV